MTTTMPTLRLGMAGLGGASRALITSANQHPRFRLVAAADVDEEALARFKAEEGGQTYTNVEEMCANPEIDAVYVATPNQFHVEHATAVLSHGKHLMIEKPMAMTLEESDIVIREAERRDRVLVVCAMHSFSPPIREILRMLRDGDLGTLRMMHCWLYGDWLYLPRSAEEIDPDPRYGGGVVFRQGPHQFDLLRTIGGGMVSRVSASVGAWDRERPVPGSFTACLHFDDGVVATAVHNGYDRFHTSEITRGHSEPRDNEAYGRARRSLKELQAQGKERAMKRATGYAASGPWSVGPTYPVISNMLFVVTGDRAEVRLSPTGLIYYGEDEIREIPLAPVPPYQGLLDELYEGVVNGILPSHDGRWGKATLEVCLAVVESSRQGREIRLRHQVQMNQPTEPRMMKT